MKNELNMRTIIDKFKLDGKVVLVTGGSRGIGLSIGIALGQAGAIVCFNGLSEDRLKSAGGFFDKQGITNYSLIFDVCNETEVDKGITMIEKKYGTIDILVNNAGTIIRSPIIGSEVEDFRKVIETNLISSYMISKRVVLGMIKKGGGKIINICSMMSELGRNSVAAYASSKGGLKMLTKNMCVEWAKYNIQVNGIGPGYFKTDKTVDFIQKDHPFNKLVMMRTPAARWGEPDDLGGAALLLASEAGNYINGHILYVDGGILSNFGYLEGENETVVY
jgi:gluconate 5-dehydrogenase